MPALGTKGRQEGRVGTGDMTGLELGCYCKLPTAGE